MKAVERVKAMLAAERTGAEWEILEGEEWAEEGEEGEGGSRFEGTDRGKVQEGGGVTRLGMGETGVLVKGTGEGEREKANGWMKVKSRSSPDGSGLRGGR